MEVPNELDIDVEKWITNRLLIERTKDEDFDELAPMLLDRNVTEYIDLFPLQFRSIEDCKKYLREMSGEGNLMFTIRIKTTNEAIGQVGFYVYDGNISISYWIGTKYQNNGFAPEASVDLSSHIFQKSHFQTFAIYFHLSHIPAAKSALKVKNGILKEHPEWIFTYKERDIEKYIISNINDEKVTVTRTNPETSSKESKSPDSEQDKCSFPDELLSIGTKFELHCGFYIISKIKT